MKGTVSMTMKPSKADVGTGGLFVIGLVFTLIGATSNKDFLPIGIPFLIIGLGGIVFTRAKSKKQADHETDDSED